MPLREDNILEGSLVRLAALTEDDAAHLVRFQRNAAYSRLLDTWPARPRSKEEIVKWIEDEAKRDTVYHFSIHGVAAVTLAPVVGIPQSDAEPA